MKTFLYILQLNAGLKDIINFDNKSIDLSNNTELPIFLWNKTVNQCQDSQSEDSQSEDSQSERSQYKNIISWNHFFQNTNDSIENDFDLKSIKFQIIFIINSILHYKYDDKKVEKLTSIKYYLIKNIINNIFLSSSLKEKIEEVFFKTQRTYLAFIKFANIVRHKIFKEKINIDLRLETINPNNKYSILLYHYHSKYFFVLSDLNNIIENSITNSSDMFSKPLYPKNPYNNLPFTKTNLYNIYFANRSVFLNVPFWLQLFFLSDFNLKKFSSNNEQTLREYIIKKYIIHTSIDDLYDETIYMISHYDYIFRKTQIHIEFPKKTLVDIFRPYLFLYIFYQNSIEGSEKKNNAINILKRKLKEFVDYNPQFGRKLINTKLLESLNYNFQTDVKKQTTNVTFNTNHNKFNLKDACNLLESG
jgi:hypothetical protein